MSVPDAGIILRFEELRQRLLKDGVLDLLTAGEGQLAALKDDPATLRILREFLELRSQIPSWYLVEPGSESR